MYDRDEEQRDEFIAKRATVRSAELRAKLAAGDAMEVGMVDDYLGVLLFDSSAWAKLIQSTAQGKNAFAELMDQAIAAIAECRAVGDAERADQDRQRDTAEYRYESIKADRDAVVSAMYRSVFPMYH